MSREDTIRKVQALRRLAKNNNSPAEASSAAAKALSMMSAHGLSEADVGGTAAPCRAYASPPQQTEPIPDWIQEFINSMAQGAARRQREQCERAQRNAQAARA